MAVEILIVCLFLIFLCLIQNISPSNPVTLLVNSCVFSNRFFLVSLNIYFICCHGSFLVYEYQIYDSNANEKNSLRCLRYSSNPEHSKNNFVLISSPTFLSSPSIPLHKYLLTSLC